MDTQSTTETPPRLTLAQVRERVSSDKSVPRRRRNDIRSSLKRFGELVGCDLASLPADLQQLRPKLEKLHPAQTGLSRSYSWNIRADIVHALRLVGIPVLPPQHLPVSPKWLVLRDLLPKIDTRLRLRKFFVFCDSLGLDPDQVTAETFAVYERALHRGSLYQKPARIYRETCRSWNRAANAIPGWPPLRVPEPVYERAPHLVAWESMSVPFRADCENYIAWLSGYLLNQPPRVVGPSTVQEIRQHIRCLASALAHRGYSIGSLISLCDLVEIEKVKEAFRHQVNRHGGRCTQYHHAMACTLIRIARDWVKVDDKHLYHLCRVRKQLGKYPIGLAQSTREMLRQFNSDHNKRLLLSLPDRLMSEAITRDKQHPRAPTKAQKAVMLELLIAAPMLPQNLARLRVDQHLYRPDGPRGAFHVTLPPSETKYGLGRTYALSHRTTRLIDQYLTLFRPRLVNGNNPWLFPGQSGSFKRPNTIRLQVGRIIFQKTGLRVNPSHFRQIVAKLILDEQPGAYELVRLILGHSRLQVTLQQFGYMEMEQVVHRYDRLLLRLREGTPAPPTGHEALQ